MRRYLAECIGTFILVFAGTGAIVSNAISQQAVTHVGIAITFGLVVMSMIYAVGDISGAHLNPAVTLGFVLAGRLPWRDSLPYIIAQLVGATLASICVRTVIGNVSNLGATIPSGSAMQSFWLELILTAILMFVILNVATGPKETGLLAGIAIGGVIALEAMFAGPISGASMNPARSFAPAIVGGNLQHLWIYLTAPFAGGIVAVPIWKVIHTYRKESI